MMAATANNGNRIHSSRNKQQVAEEDEEGVVVQLPGFRFYPTDQELVGFYLRRKVENKPFTVELINQIDIYKFDPWDLPKPSAAGDSEGYFFCQRGRKYKNSIRPNRVTGSGFWKATGIDKPIYSVVGAKEAQTGSRRSIIGLKKSLVFYRGCAGKGTKTDWMMHEFRLPPNLPSINTPKMSQEAEVWTLCRIFRRNVTSRKYTENWREISTKKKNHPCSMKPETADQAEYISFQPQVIPNTNATYSTIFVPSSHENQMNSNETTTMKQPYPYPPHVDQRHSLISNYGYGGSNPASVANSTTTSDSSTYCPDQLLSGGGGLFTEENWDELRSFVEFALSESPRPRSLSI